MQRIDTSTAVASIPTPSSGGTPGYATNGNPATSEPATVLDADWVNSVQEELMAPILAAGLSPSKTTRNQLLQSLPNALASRPEMAKDHSTAGYQRLPGGLVLQWGGNSVTGGSNTLVTFPIAFPNNVLQVIPGVQAAADSSTPIGAGWQAVSASQFRLRNLSGTTANISWLAIGY